MLLRNRLNGNMATANLTLPDGTKVNLEGSADEVATLLAKFSGRSVPDSESQREEGRSGRRKPRQSAGNKSKRKGPQVLIAELVDENFFKSKKTLGDVQKKLEEKGHIYAQESLSGPLLRLTRDKHVLRRIKDKKGWVYVS